MQRSAAAVAAGGLLGQQSISAQSMPSGGVFVSGSDTMRIGLIGAGGRGTQAAMQAMNTQSGNVELTAVADAFAGRANGAVQACQQDYKDKCKVPENQVFVGVDAYKRLLDTDVQLVILATPPGFRPMQFEAAIKAGKHVFMEKPVAVDVPGVQQILRATEEAKQKGLAVGVGLQRRHERAYMETIDKLREGAIGDLVYARVYWNQGPLWVVPKRKDQSELDYQIRNWLYFNWLSGDHIVEQHIHNLDVINWLMNDYPVSARGSGGRQVRLGPQHGEIFDHHCVEYRYGNGMIMFSQCRQIPGCWNDVSEHVYGTKGYCDISAGVIYDLAGNVTFRTNGGRGGHQQEHHDLFADLAKGVIPNEGEYGAKSTMTAIMGRMATYSGKNIEWQRAMKSQKSLADIGAMTGTDGQAPVQPMENGEYKIAVPGDGWADVLDWNPDKAEE
jgi:predicted dehydrogenase